MRGAMYSCGSPTLLLICPEAIASGWPLFVFALTVRNLKTCASAVRINLPATSSTATRFLSESRVALQLKPGRIGRCIKYVPGQSDDSLHLRSIESQEWPQAVASTTWLSGSGSDKQPGWDSHVYFPDGRRGHPRLPHTGDKQRCGG